MKEMSEENIGISIVISGFLLGIFGVATLFGLGVAAIIGGAALFIFGTLVIDTANRL